MNRVTLPLLTAVLLALGGCATSSDSPSESKHSDAAPVEQQKQTWPKPYGETTCDEWNDEMTDAQRWTASADLLIAARNRDGSKGLPSNDQAAGFEEGLTSSCSVSDPIDAVADAVYKTDPATFGS